MAACKRVFVLERRTFATDFDKILYTLSFMQEGHASTWADTVTEELFALTEEQQKAAPWATFEDRFFKIFGHPDEAQHARNELQTLQQGKKTVEEYVAEFETVAPRTKWDDATLEFFFVEGLNSRVREKLETAENPPVNLEAWKERAGRVDRNWRIHQDKWKRGTEVRKTGASTSSSFVPRPATNNPRPRDPNAMDIDQNRREQLMKEGKCFRCEEKGHRSRDCPKKSSRPTGTTIRATSTTVDPAQEIEELRRRIAELEGGNGQGGTGEQDF
jgi:hypothetical protein